MRKSIVMVLTLATLLLLATGCSLLADPPTPSAPLEAIPLTEAEPSPTTASDPVAEDPPEPTASPAASVAATETAAPTATATAAPAERRIYSISSADSLVTFELDEDLRGQRKTVVGSTDQVAGEIGLALDDLSTAEVGTIRINARTLTTDNNFRNRAIQNEILDTGEFEFITFTPTAVNGLPATAEIGEEVSFTIDGELTIRDVTQPVTFAVVATATSAEELAGTATATVSRDAYGLAIPQVPNVANVEDEVALAITFVATTQAG